jgi:hypothetical protein
MIFPYPFPAMPDMGKIFISIHELIVSSCIFKQSLTLPHRRHFYQVLANEAEIDHWKVSAGYGIAQMMIGLIVWFAVSINLFLGIFVIGIFIISFFMVNMMVKKKLGCWPGSADFAD